MRFTNLKTVLLAAAVVVAACLVSLPLAAAESGRFERSFGVLLHPTSLPSPYGIGDLGKNAFRFVDYLKSCGATLWQTLPIGPAGAGNSPYACFSAFAGNPLLIDPEGLAEDRLLTADDLRNLPAFSETKVEFERVTAFKQALFEKAYRRFRNIRSGPLHADYGTFLAANDAGWLDAFALFMALKERHKGAGWSDWDPPIARRDPKALARLRSRLSRQVGYYKFLQFEFFRQWTRLKAYANEKGIKLVGDIPIFVAYDSADVWVHPGVFRLDGKGRPLFVAGVPPDKFSKTGQYWGNPVYDWEALRQSGFTWWVDRVRQSLGLFDILRIDHFRGFEAYWEIPAGEKTAEKGKWVKAPGRELFATIRNAFGAPPIIAEDLGVITPEVEALRDEFGFYGMKILQFGFSDQEKDRATYLPHTFTHPRSIVYTGTHDNETTQGWFQNLTPDLKRFVLDYTGFDGRTMGRDMVRLALSTVCDVAIVPFQDILSLDNAGRMNTPGTAGDMNWGYRIRSADLRASDAEHLLRLCILYDR